MPLSDVTYKSFMIDFLIDTRYRIGRHLLLVLFFVFVSFNMIYLSCVDVADPRDGILFLLSMFLLMVYLGGIYLHIYVLLPGLLLKHRYIPYVVIISVLILFFLFIAFGSDYFIMKHYGGRAGRYSFFYKDRILAIEIIGNFCLYALLIAGTSMTVLFRHWMAFSRRKNELESANLKTELGRLKDRINPEFLFAMLDEAREKTPSDPQLASLILMKLSKLLRYQLYDGNREKILLISEIAFIRDFLNLAQVRYRQLNFMISTDGDVSREMIPPLLFIPFAIHYVKIASEQDIAMDLHFSFISKGQELLFSCICFAPGLQESGEKDPALSDLEHRLDLLYPGRYLLRMTGDQSIYRNHLSLKL